MGISICPSCGSGKIKKVLGRISREYEGLKYSVPDVEYYECPDCGERIYGREAVRKIQSKSPAFQRNHAR
jgi:YgiT-type zinc finger domain-containing protein